MGAWRAWSTVLSFVRSTDRALPGWDYERSTDIGSMGVRGWYESAVLTRAYGGTRVHNPRD
eukprot:202212-Rhodomonas_salina.2